MAMLMPGDIVLVKGSGWLARAIRFFTRSFGESRTKINHVGLICDPGDIEITYLIEALWHVVRRRLWEGYGVPSNDKVAVYRPVNLSDGEQARIVAYAWDQVGRPYGVLKIAAHLLDWSLAGVYLFRRLTASERYPICSWLVAHAYAQVGKSFGVRPGAATPDDIWDFVVRQKDKYELVHPLKHLGDPD